MEIKQHLKHALLAASALLFCGTINAQIINVNYPAVEIASSGGTDVSLTDNGGGNADLSINGLAIDVIQFFGESSDDINPDETFSLTGSATDFTGTGGTFSGSFSIGGGLASGTFSGLNVNQYSFLGSTTGDAGGYMDITSGSLLQGLASYTGGFVINWSGDALASSGGMIGSGKLDVPAVPVPAAVWLFGSGLLGLVGIARRKSA